MGLPFGKLVSDVRQTEPPIARIMMCASYSMRGVTLLADHEHWWKNKSVRLCKHIANWNVNI